MRRALFALLIALSGMAVAHAPAPVSADDTSYYLALGDSLAYGYQPNGDVTHGYVQDVWGKLQQTTPGLQLVDLGCVKESTVTMIGQKGQFCPYWQQTYGMTTTPQLTQALSFLRSHAGQVRLVTIDIGANDLNALFAHLTFANLLAMTARLSANLHTIFAQVRAAAGPNVRIVTMTYYDPYVVNYRSPLVPIAAAVFNDVIASAAQKYSVGVARVYKVFNLVPAPQQQICSFTWYCDAAYPNDPHPNTAGYQVIANAFVQAGL